MKNIDPLNVERAKFYEQKKTMFDLKKEKRSMRNTGNVKDIRKISDNYKTTLKCNNLVINVCNAETKNKIKIQFRIQHTKIKMSS